MASRFSQSFAANPLEVALQRLAFGHWKRRKRIVDFVQLQVAALGKLHRPADNMRRMRKKPRHLVGGLDVELVGVELEPLRVVHRSRGLNAKQNLVRAAVVRRNVVRIVGRNQRNVEFLLHPEHRVAHLLVRAKLMVLNLQEEIAAPKDVLILPCGRLCLVVLSLHNLLRNLTGEAARKTNQSPGILRQKILAHTRLAVEAMERSLGSQANQIAIAFFVLREHQQVVVLQVRIRLGAMVIFLADVKLAPKDGLDSLLLRSVEEVHGAKDIAMVGHGDSGLAQRMNMLDQFVYVAGAVEQRIICMQMEVGKLSGHISSLVPLTA